MRCCVDFCSNTSGSASTPVGKSRSEPEGVSFHRFPSEVRLRAAWLRALGKQDCQLPDSAVVCSQHFLRDEICETEDGMRQLCAGAVPSAVLVCMICFDTSSKMILMKRNDLREAYAKLTGQSLSDRGNLKHTLCVMCAQRLRNFNRFRDKCLRARSVMRDLLEINKLITIQHIKLIDRVIYQLNNDLVCTTIGPNHWDLYVQENYNAKALMDLAENQTTSKSKIERSVDSLWVPDDISDDNIVVLESKVTDEVSSKANSSVNQEKGDVKDPLKCESLEHSYGAQDSGSDGDCQTDTRQHKPPATASSHHDTPLITASCTTVSSPTMKYATRSALKTRTSVRGDEAQKTNNGDQTTRKQFFICDTCQRGFKTKPKLISHLNTHKEKMFSCSICNIASKYKRSLKKHLKIHGEKKPCPLCDYVGNTEGSSKKTHTRERSFSCDICEFKCHRKVGLSIHMTKHTGVSPFACEFCDFSTSVEYTMKIHKIRKHSDEMGFAWKLPEYKSRRAYLKVRVEKTFACKQCEFVAANKADLVAHVRTHPKDRPFSCQLCEYRCAEKRDYERHMRAHFR